MSEPKARFIDDTYAEYYNTGKHELAQVYLKSEADKVIAEKDKELRHHKFKRCLDKAETCQARYDEADVRVNGRGASWDFTSDEMKFWERWHKRWLELAEKFKEAK